MGFVPSGGCHPRLMSDTPLGCVPTITRTGVLAGNSTIDAFGFFCFCFFCGQQAGRCRMRCPVTSPTPGQSGRGLPHSKTRSVLRGSVTPPGFGVRQPSGAFPRRPGLPQRTPHPVPLPTRRTLRETVAWGEGGRSGALGVVPRAAATQHPVTHSSYKPVVQELVYLIAANTMQIGAGTLMIPRV
jgi:hypothetical protein